MAAAIAVAAGTDTVGPMDLLEDDLPAPGGNLPEFSVSEISGAIKRTLEGEFGRVRVRGEIGRVFRARSGHLYYDVKDERNVLACTTWKGQISSLGVEPEEGLEVVVTGRLSAFGAQSKYNLNVDAMEVAGAGALMAMLEKRKKQLAAEGLFDEARKRPLPYLPGVIGVITSPQGAVIRDILHRLRERFPRRVLIWPVAVQGKPCAPEVANAIRGFNALAPGGAIPRPDVLIVARGGGSLEDLWGFNEEIVARAAAASDIPLISAVGHETDTTLIDFVSDRRAPTPTAAAEIAVPVRLDLIAAVRGFGARLDGALQAVLRGRAQRLGDVSRALPRPDAVLAPYRQRADLAAERLPAAARRALAARRLRLGRVEGRMGAEGLRARLLAERRRLVGLSARLEAAPRQNHARSKQSFEMTVRRLSARPLQQQIARMGERLNARGARLGQLGRAQVASEKQRLGALDRLMQSLGYKATLARGYAVVRGDGDVVTTTGQAKKAGVLEIEFADGRFAPGAPPTKPAKPKKPPEPGSQGSLF